jgi:hypothetical protein
MQTGYPINRKEKKRKKGDTHPQARERNETNKQHPNIPPNIF